MRGLLLALALALALVPAAAGAAPTAPGEPQPLVPRELASLSSSSHVLLGIDLARERPAARRLRAAGAVELSRPLGIWRVPAARARALVPELATAGLLREFQPDRVLAATDHLTAGDPLLETQWWLERIGTAALEPPGAGVPLTLIDSGVDLEHEEFAGRPDTLAVNPQTVGGEGEFHGTAVASIAAAPANGIGLVGVYPRARLHVFDASPLGVFSSSTLITGLDRAAAVGRGVVNLSLGGVQREPLEEQAILRAFDRGVVIVAAAGNEREEGNPPSFPGHLAHVLTAGASDSLDRVAYFSTESPTVDVVAPGQDIRAAVPFGLAASPYATVDGTSMAAPIVSAAAAWVWTLRPELDKTQLLEVMRRSARDIGLPGRDPAAGFGLLDVGAALTYPAPRPDPLEPNDDVNQVAANRLFRMAKSALTRPAHPRAAVTARLDHAEDRRDVYRVWIPSRYRLSATLTSDRDVDLELWRPGTASVAVGAAARTKNVVAASARRGSATETVSTVNRGRGAYFYLAAFLRVGEEASYRISIRSARARR